MSYSKPERCYNSAEIPEEICKKYHLRPFPGRNDAPLMGYYINYYRKRMLEYYPNYAMPYTVSWDKETQFGGRACRSFKHLESAIEFMREVIKK